MGLYGLIAYSVAQRTRELAIRLAIGATNRSVLVLVLWGEISAFWDTDTHGHCTDTTDDC